MQPSCLEGTGGAPGEARLHIPASGCEASSLATGNSSAWADSKADLWRDNDDRPRGIRVTCQARAKGAFSVSPHHKQAAVSSTGFGSLLMTALCPDTS